MPYEHKRHTRVEIGQPTEVEGPQTAISGEARLTIAMFRAFVSYIKYTIARHVLLINI